MPHRLKSLRFRALLLLILGLTALTSQVRGTELPKVTFIPQWLPQAQFAGFYVAYEKGFYRRYGLEVDILRGGPGKPPSELLETGEARFGTMFLATAIARRAQGLPLVNIGQLVQRSALMLVAKKSGGINAPRDLHGKKVGVWGADFQIQPRAFFRKYHLNVHEVPQSATINLFLRGGVEAASAMWYNEYHLILNAGLDSEELTTFFFADLGLNFPEDGIYCLESTFKKHPRMCRNFVQASMEGWRYAFEHPQEALDIVMKYVTAAHAPTNRVHQKWMLDRMKDIILPPSDPAGLGVLKAEDYYFTAGELKSIGIIKEIPDYSDFFIKCVTHEE